MSYRYIVVPLAPRAAPTSTRPVFSASKRLSLSTSRLSLSWVSNQAVRNAREDHARLEEQQTLDVERPLVVQQPLRPAEDQLRHDHDGDRLRIRGDLVQGTEQRIPDVTEGRLFDLERDAHAARRPLRAQTLGLVVLEREEERLCVLEPEGRGVVHRAHRRGVRARNEQSTYRPLRQRQVAVLGQDGNVGDDDSRLPQQPELERQLRAA